MEGFQDLANGVEKGALTLKEVTIMLKPSSSRDERSLECYEKAISHMAFVPLGKPIKTFCVSN